MSDVAEYDEVNKKCSLCLTSTFKSRKSFLKHRRIKHTAPSVKTGRAARQDVTTGDRATKGKAAPVEGETSSGAQHDYVLPSNQKNVRDHFLRNKKAEAKAETKQNDMNHDNQHNDYCEMCNQGGDLVMCDYCTLSYHRWCLVENLAILPDNWLFQQRRYMSCMYPIILFYFLKIICFCYIFFTA